MPEVGIFLIFVFWMIIAGAAKAVKKAAAKANPGKSPAEKKPVKYPEPEPQSVSVPVSAEMEPVQLRMELTPFAPREGTFSGSLGAAADRPGSLGGFSDEGIDPCHGDQSLEMDLLEAEQPETEQTGELCLPMFTGSEMAKAFVMSEILKRKGA